MNWKRLALAAMLAWMPVSGAGGAQAAGLQADFPDLLFYYGPRTEKKVALTFDDGPDAFYTRKILGILQENGIHATFFIVGRQAKKHPEVVKEIARAGHVLGNHTWGHHNLAKMPEQDVQTEIAKTDEILYSLLGYHPALLRPPFGSTTAEVVAEAAAMQYKVVNWSVDTRDWAGTPTIEILEKVQQQVKPGAIILQHCAGGRQNDLSNTLAALPLIIAMLKAQGYTFVTVPELLNISGQNE
ncbi:polysaccharide deacetylase family protein [Brevibacillus massiliensis]|uniref:polysaccharide deacetylase family protein n=1 Tax=Brevibacillus massiliensis TaxID=1118054 RepID=UPI0003089C13|nr:polysaccharide deacetylase family protein [Brevibacillus massiliensis]